VAVYLGPAESVHLKEIRGNHARYAPVQADRAGGRLPRMDEDDDPQPDAYSTLYDPLRGLRELLLSRFSWWQRALLVVGAFIVVVVIALLATIRIIP
jgi:hypothetical protein